MFVSPHTYGSGEHVRDSVLRRLGAPDPSAAFRISLIAPKS